MKDLICKYNGEVIATGTVRLVEEFIFIDRPYMNTEVLNTFEDFKNWLNKHPCWQLAA